jgi:hypothetical protein
MRYLTLFSWGLSLGVTGMIAGQVLPAAIASDQYFADHSVDHGKDSDYTERDQKPIENTPVHVSQYRQLQSFLRAGKFKEADLETRRIMLRFAPLDRPDAVEWRNWTRKRLPCNSLREIADLWEHYSNGRFGWRVQLQIYKEEKARHRDNPLNPFWQRLGWEKGDRQDARSRRYERLNFSLQAPVGHLPTFALWTGQEGGIAGWFWDRTLVPRLMECQIDTPS